MIEPLVCPVCGTDNIVHEEMVAVQRPYLHTRTTPTEAHVFASSTLEDLSDGTDEILVCVDEGHEFPIPDVIEWV